MQQFANFRIETKYLYLTNYKRETMKTKKNKLGYYIIGSAIIWGAVIVGCALKLKGTDCYYYELKF